MKKDFEISIDKTIHQLTELDSNIIGLAKIMGDIELVFEINDATFVTGKIGSLLGFSTSHYPISKYGHCVYLFPDNKTLKDMKDSVYELADFCKTFNI